MVVDARAASTPWQLFRQVAVHYGDRVAITRGSETLSFRNWLEGSIAYASA